MSRKPRPENTPAALEWAQADVLTGEGLAESTRNVDVVIHGATSPSQDIHAVEVEGVRNVLHAGRAAHVSHLIYVSIVGIDRTPYEYYTANSMPNAWLPPASSHGASCAARSFTN